LPNQARYYGKNQKIGVGRGEGGEEDFVCQFLLKRQIINCTKIITGK